MYVSYLSQRRENDFSIDFAARRRCVAEWECFPVKSTQLEPEAAWTLLLQLGPGLVLSQCDERASPPAAIQRTAAGSPAWSSDALCWRLHLGSIVARAPCRYAPLVLIKLALDLVTL